MPSPDPSAARPAITRRRFTRDLMAAGAGAGALAAGLATRRRAAAAVAGGFGIDHRPPAAVEPDFNLQRLAFGSCCRQDRPAPLLSLIARQEPDLFLWLGDNIYADTVDMDKMRADYRMLADKPEYRQLLERCPVIAVWDDHDYGWNDAGREYEKKEESKGIFLEFFNEPRRSPRWNTEGIHTSYLLGPEERRVQVILPDLRTFRTLQVSDQRIYDEMGSYIQDHSDEAAMLGEAQWAWLETELRKPARLRLIGMSTQFVPGMNGFELWWNYPAEQQRLLDLIRDTGAEGVVFLAGDTHWAELAVMERPGLYPLYELTGSAINQSWEPAGPNDLRLFEAYPHPNFGLVEIDWDRDDPQVTLRSLDEHGGERLRWQVGLSQLTFDQGNLREVASVEGMAGTWQSRFGPVRFQPQAGDSTADGDRWRADYGDGHHCELLVRGAELHGRWTENDRSGAVRFRLTRDRRHVQGAYGRGDGPALLDWACWDRR